jgi:hypothetical protein
VPIVKVNSRNRMTAVLNKVCRSFKLILIVLAVMFYSEVAIAQRPSPTPRRPPTPRPVDGQAQQPDLDDRPLTTFEEEIRAKREIKMAEKEHKENLDRAREIEQIGKELHETLKNSSTLNRTALKKIERLEKLTKKIRGEAGGEGEEVKIVNHPSDIPSAALQIAEVSRSLAKDVQDTPRQVVSLSVIGNANVLLELIKLLRAFDHRP